MPKKNFVALLLLHLVILTNSQNFIATWTFDNVNSTTGIVDPGPSPVVDGIKFGQVTYSGNDKNPNASARFSFGDWPLGATSGDDNYANLAGVLSPTIFFELGLKMAPGYTLDLKTFSFNIRRSSTGPRSWAIRSSIDNYTDNIAVTTGTNTRMSVIPTNVFFWNFDSVSVSSDQRGCSSLPDTLYNGISDTLCFRLYAWNAESANGTFSIDNLAISGFVRDSLWLIAGQSAQEHSPMIIFPNPVRNGRFLISCTEPLSEVRLFDVNGSAIKLEISPVPGGVEVISPAMRDLPGLYFILLKDGLTVRRLKVLAE